ncbi:MAG: hypothetical protein ACLT3D_04805 [Lawsonibacter sp.]
MVMCLLFEEGGFVLRDIRVENGKIKEIAPELQAAEGEEVFDASGKYVTPGMIDAHSHICISEEGMGSIGDDCCDYSGALTPELEVLDGIYPFDRAVIDSVRAGVTAACVCPGERRRGGRRRLHHHPERHGSRRDATAALHCHEVQRGREPQDRQARL